MNKNVKIIAIVAAVIVVVIIGIVLFLNLRYISKDEVREAVASEMNADEKDLRFSSIDLETDEKVYDVDVYYNNMEYEFKVDAHDGEVVYTNYTPSNDTGNTNGQGNVNGDVQGQPVVDEGITIDEAKALVLQDNNLTENDVQFTKADRDYDNNNLVYDIEFVYNNVEYNYEVRAIDGQIISFEQDDAH